MDKRQTMKAIGNNVIIKMDTRQKERYALGDSGIVLEISRGYDFNLRQDRPALAEIIDGANLPAGTDVLVNYLALEPGYEVQGEEVLTNNEREQGYKIFSIPQDMCFAYFDKGEWQPCKEYLITMRIFKPYLGKLVGIEPEIVKHRMYVIKGFSEGDENDRVDLSGTVAVTLDYADYQIIWHDKKNKEQNLIRTRDREIIGTDEGLLKELKNGKYFIGFSPSNCKPLNELVHGKNTSRGRSGNNPI